MRIDAIIYDSFKHETVLIKHELKNKKLEKYEFKKSAGDILDLINQQQIINLFATFS